MLRISFHLIIATVTLLILILGFMVGAEEDDTQVSSSGMTLSDLRLEDEQWKSMLEGSAVERSSVADGRLTPSSYDSLLTETAELASDDGLLVMRHAVFDPADGLPKSQINHMFRPPSVEVMNSIKSISRRSYRVLQFSGPIDPYRVRELREAGIDTVGYIPNNAYLAAVKAGEEDRLSGLGGLRWSGEVPLLAKIDSSLLEALGRETLDELSLLQLAAYRTEDLEGWSELARQLRAQKVLYSSTEGSPRMMLEVPRSAVADLVSAFIRLPGLENIRLFRTPSLLNSGSIWLLQSGETELRSTPLFEAGLTGWGQIYAAVDSGLDTDGCQFRYNSRRGAQTMAQDLSSPDFNISDPDSKVIAYYVLAGADAYDESTGGYHGTATTGCAVGDNYNNLAGRDYPGIDQSDGMAPAAQVVFQDAGNVAGALYGLAYSTQYGISRQAYDSGARVHNDSYGLADTSVYYDQDSQQLDDFAWEKNDYTIFFAAGNSGPSEQTLGGEGSTAKNTLCVGASLPAWYEFGEDLIYFSSRGPTSDGRLKPDIVVPGLVETAVESSGRTVEGKLNVYGYPAMESRTDPPNNQCAVSVTAGTSFASPTAAGMGLLARQYFTDGYYPSGERNADDGFEPSSSLIRAVMINSGRSLTGDVVAFRGNGDVVSVGKVDSLPSTHQGWGRVTLDDALYLKGDRRDLALLAEIPNSGEGVLLQGDEVSYDLYVKAGESLKITLAWIDPSPTLAAGRMLVNDLDLEVKSPSGFFYRGNLGYENGQSKPVAANLSPDTINPQEQVIIRNPETGLYRITVKGSDIPGNGRFWPHESTEQGYSLIATGDLGEGEDTLLPRLSSRFFMAGGGCDNDDSLDINEVVTVTLDVLNSGDGASGPLTAVVSPVFTETDIDISTLFFPQDGVFDVAKVEAKSKGQYTVKVGLGVTEEDVCEKRATFLVTLFDEDGLSVAEMKFSLVLGIDYLEDLSLLCQDTICNPPPTLDSASPTTLAAGESGFKIKMSGHYLKSGLSLRFEPDVLDFDSIDVPDPTQLILRNVSVDEEAEAGSVTVYLSNPEEAELSYEDLLEVLAPPDPATDGDGETSESELETDTDVVVPPGSGGGCSATARAGSAAWMAFSFLIILVWRRKRVW